MILVAYKIAVAVSNEAELIRLRKALRKVLSRKKSFSLDMIEYHEDKTPRKRRKGGEQG